MILNGQNFFKYSAALVGGALLLLSSQPALSNEANSSFPSDQYAPPYEMPPSDQTTSLENRPLPSPPAMNRDQTLGYPKTSKVHQENIYDGLSQPEHYETQYSAAAHSSDPNSQFEEPPTFQNSNAYDQNEILAAGHSFFGGVTSGLANGIEYLFQSQGKPNAYILGEDAGGAFLLGLRYGEGNMHLKNSSPEKVFWQGPTIGYDAGAEGSKTMILVYNLEDTSQIYDRYAGVQGAIYFIGGLSIQLQKHGNVTLALIRSGVGLRLGANVGYLNYTRTPSWNPL